MKLEQVLREVEGLNKRFVYYLEAQGYIHPTQIPKQRIARRDYSPADVARIKAIWRYYRRGYSLQAAAELAQRAERQQAYALFPVPQRRLRHTLELLRSLDMVEEAAALYAADASMLVRIRAADDADVYDVLAQVFRQQDIAGLPTVWRIQERWQGAPQVRAAPEHAPQGKPGEQRAMLAYVLIRVPAKHVGGLLEELRKYEYVREVSAIYGETDVIAKVVVPNQEALDDLIINKIQEIPVVESTRTFIAIGGMHWSRD
jgi:DNA-binding Lrp family transcriptional regulator